MDLYKLFSWIGNHFTVLLVKLEKFYVTLLYSEDMLYSACAYGICVTIAYIFATNNISPHFNSPHAALDLIVLLPAACTGKWALQWHDFLSKFSKYTCHCNCLRVYVFAGLAAIVFELFTFCILTMENSQLFYCHFHKLSILPTAALSTCVCVRVSVLILTRQCHCACRIHRFRCSADCQLLGVGEMISKRFENYRFAANYLLLL